MIPSSATRLVPLAACVPHYGSQSEECNISWQRGIRYAINKLVLLSKCAISQTVNTCELNVLNKVNWFRSRDNLSKREIQEVQECGIPQESYEVPARSIKLSRLNRMLVMPLSFFEWDSMIQVNTECDLLDSLFMFVSPTLRFSDPFFISAIASSTADPVVGLGHSQ